MTDDVEKEVLRQELVNLTERVNALSDRENEHYTEIVLLLREIQDKLDERIDMSETLTEDELLEEATKLVRAAGKASTSYLQRRLGIGYARAAHLMDALEEAGVIGTANGARPREVIKYV